MNKEEDLYYKYMFNSLKRVIQAGYKSFSRNIGLSLATVFIMILVLILLTFLFLLRPTADILIQGFEEKIDISVYFKEYVLGEDVLSIKESIKENPDIKEIEYISKEQALDAFEQRHKDNPVIMESLKEIGFNPFVASLSIKATEIDKYEQIAEYLEASPYATLIDNIDFFERRTVIETVASLNESIKSTLFIFIFILGMIGFLVGFNTIKMGIYSLTEEIKVMKLVGASNWFVRGPFLIQGIIVGGIAALAALLITLLLSYGFDTRVQFFIPEFSIFNLFTNNFWSIVLLQFGAGIGLGIFSSIIAIRKYLEV